MRFRWITCTVQYIARTGSRWVSFQSILRCGGFKVASLLFEPRSVLQREQNQLNRAMFDLNHKTVPCSSSRTASKPFFWFQSNSQVVHLSSLSVPYYSWSSSVSIRTCSASISTLSQFTFVVSYIDEVRHKQEVRDHGCIK